MHYTIKDSLFLNDEQKIFYDCSKVTKEEESLGRNDTIKPDD